MTSSNLEERSNGDVYGDFHIPKQFVDLLSPLWASLSAVIMERKRNPKHRTLKTFAKLFWLHASHNNDNSESSTNNLLPERPSTGLANPSIHLSTVLPKMVIGDLLCKHGA